MTIRNRLASYRAKAAKSGADWRTYVRPRVSTAGSWERVPHGSSRAYYCDNWPTGLRYVGLASELASLRHTGWYTDNYQRDTLSGHVLMLPGRDGTPRYIPGTSHSDWGGVTLYPLDVYDTERDAAYAADRLVEINAEKAREEDAKSHAEQEIEEARAAIVECRSDLRALLRELKQAREHGPTVCEALRAHVRSLRRKSHSAWKRIETLTENPWEAVR